MFDKPELRLSEFYFAVLQILRIAYDWIKGSMDDLRRLVDDMENNHYSVEPLREGRPTFLSESPEKQALEIQLFKRNWRSVLSHQQDIGRELLDRISRRQEEVKSLRDGVCLSSFSRQYQRNREAYRLTQCNAALQRYLRQ